MAPKKRVPKINVGEFPYIDIMPLSRREAIERGVAKTKWIKIVTGGAVVALILSLGAVGFNFSEQINYDNALSAQKAVETKIAAHSDVDNALTLKDLLTKNVDKASKSSIQWGELHKRISENLPEGSTLTSLDALTGGTIEKKPAVAVLTNISSDEPIAYSKVLDAFSKIPGLVDGSLQIGNMFAQKSTDPTTGNPTTVYVYPVAFSVDSSILVYDFAANKKKDPPAAPEKTNSDVNPNDLVSGDKSGNLGQDIAHDVTDPLNKAKDAAGQADANTTKTENGVNG